MSYTVSNWRVFETQRSFDISFLINNQKNHGIRQCRLV